MKPTTNCITGIQQVGIGVEDAAAAFNWYNKVLGLNVPVFDDWSGYLWQAGQSAMLLRKTRSNNCLKLWTVDLDVDSWTRIITGGLSEGIIQLPEQS